MVDHCTLVTPRRCALRGQEVPAVFGGRLIPTRRRGATGSGSGDESTQPVAAADSQDGSARSGGHPGPAERSAPLGPFDLANLPDDGRQRADFGALLIPRVDGTWIRLSLNGPVPMLVATDGTSTLELSAFAAPRREPLWPTIRAGLLAVDDSPDADDPHPDDLHPDAATDAGGEDMAEVAGPVEIMGPRGPEIRVTLDSDLGPILARIVGIDGPRWLLCAVYTGPAAADPSAAPALDELLGGTVVIRGDIPLPVREPLALLPPDRHGERLIDLPTQRAGVEVVRLDLSSRLG